MVWFKARVHRQGVRKKLGARPDRRANQSGVQSLPRKRHAARQFDNGFSAVGRQAKTVDRQGAQFRRQRIQPQLRQLGQCGLIQASATHLGAGKILSVQQQRLQSFPRACEGGHGARRAGADDDHIP